MPNLDLVEQQGGCYMDQIFNGIRLVIPNKLE